MDWISFYNKVIALETPCRIVIPDAPFEEELRNMYNHEINRNPIHPYFKDHYGQSSFYLCEYMKYTFKPYCHENKINIFVTYDPLHYSYVLTKYKYGCKHEYTRESMPVQITNPNYSKLGTTNSIHKCIKCGKIL